MNFTNNGMILTYSHSGPQQGSVLLMFFCGVGGGVPQKRGKCETSALHVKVCFQEKCGQSLNPALLGDNAHFGGPSAKT